jgi:hypothetical protein
VKLKSVLVCCVSMVATPAFGQSNPADVVRAFFQAESDGRWRDAARMLDLAQFEAFRQSTVEGLRNRPARRHLTADDYMRLQPDMPRAVAEYQIKQMNDNSQRFDQLSQEFAHVTSVDSLAGLSAEEAAARWLEAQGPEWKTELAARESRMPAVVDCPELPDSARRALIVKAESQLKQVVLGATAESDTVRYVVVGQDFGFRRSSRDASVGYHPSFLPNVITVRNVGGNWRIEPALDLERVNGMGGMTTFSISCARGSGEIR